MSGCYKKSNLDKTLLQQIFGWKDVSWNRVLVNSKAFGYWSALTISEEGHNKKIYLADSFLESIVQAWTILERLRESGVQFRIYTKNDKIHVALYRNKPYNISESIASTAPEAIARAAFSWIKKQGLKNASSTAS